MPRTRLLVGLGLLAAVAAAAASAVAPRRPGPPPQVRLAVLVVFDQMRGDYVEKWRDLFGPGGFRRVQDDGAWFTDCHYPYATTTTGPGHASILSGTTPEFHGIINNEWYDRGLGANVNCSGSDRFALVPGPRGIDPEKKAQEAKKKPVSVGAPVRMLSPTVADALKAATRGRGRVFGLSLKDRSAVLPTGQRPDGAYWFAGRFVTSTFYRDAVHPWVAQFNGSGVADRWRGRSWDRFRPDLDYERHSGPDAAAGEGVGEPAWDRKKPKPVRQQGGEFPHPMDAGDKTPGDAYFAALANSPFGNELVLEFAKTCIVAERLGQDDVPDLLTLSFSANDLIGHTWGPDSQEVFDVTLRADRIVAELLRFLDGRVGAGNYVLAITADHGVSPLPETSARRGIEAGRLATNKLLQGAEEHLRKEFGTPAGAADPAKPSAVQGNPGLWVEQLQLPWVYLNYRQIRARGVPYPAVAASLAAWLRTQPGVYRTYTAGELRAGPPADDPMGQRVRRSYHPARSGDVYVVLKPYYLASDPVHGRGTTHGTPHAYDTHVPLLVYGPGIPGGRRSEPVTPQHTAAIFARFLGIQPPRDALYPVPDSLFEPPDEEE